MTLKEQRTRFDSEARIHERAKLSFVGVPGYDVYNTSIPFEWRGKRYLFGRVERRADWARSFVRLFENTGADEWTVAPDSMIYPLEDPFISWIGDTFVLGGVHVRYKSGKTDTYFSYFYRGTDPFDLRYFTTGPDYMKDIRLVQLGDGRIGVFSRPRNEEVLRRFGCESQIGFAVINGLDDLTAEVVEQAPYIAGLFTEGEWGGCNQAYLLEDGNIGVIGHKSYKDPRPDCPENAVYLNVSFVFDPERFEAGEMKIIGTRSSYPAGPGKRTWVEDVAFSSGIVMRDDGRADLYSGIGDAEEGRSVIDYPFADHGRIVSRVGCVADEEYLQMRRET